MAALLLLPLFAPAVVAGCTPVGAAVGAGAMAGSTAFQERGFRGAMSDAGIQIALNEQLFRADHTLPTDIDILVHDGRVLLAGEVDSAEDRDTAVRIAWSIEGVETVLNELRVAEGAGLIDAGRDRLIGGKLAARIKLDNRISAVNYSFTVQDGTVYMLGIAQDPAERNRVIAHARDLRHVRRIVDHTVIKPDANEERTSP